MTYKLRNLKNTQKLRWKNNFCRTEEGESSTEIPFIQAIGSWFPRGDQCSWKQMLPNERRKSHRTYFRFLCSCNFVEVMNSETSSIFLTEGSISFQIFPPGLSGTKKYYVHLETRIGIHGKPERCVNADSEGCGGIGSWWVEETCWPEIVKSDLFLPILRY